MFHKKNRFFKNLDPIVPTLTILIVMFGILNIFSVQFGAYYTFKGLLFQGLAMKQLIWLCSSVILVIGIFKIKSRLIFLTPYLLYVCALGLLLIAIIAGKSVAGHNAWVSIFGLKLQPSEPAKIATSLLIADILSEHKNRAVTQLSTQFKLILAILAPMFLILLQGDAGSAIVFLSFAGVFFIEKIFTSIIVIVLYCGTIAVLSLMFSKNYLIIFFIIIFSLLFSIFHSKYKPVRVLISIFLVTLCTIYGTSYFVDSILKPHQKNRITAWIKPDSDPLGIGWNINQSKIAIGSGGIHGKGIFNGTQTRYGFVPEQHTDFIFCTVGEEYGFLGCTIFILIYTILLLRIFQIADRQKLKFSRVYGYCIGSILFAHFFINVGMTIGLVPTIGIPLPLMSYGGSALTSFIVMIGILLKLDKERNNI